MPVLGRCSMGSNAALVKFSGSAGCVPDHATSLIVLGADDLVNWGQPAAR